MTEAYVELHARSGFSFLEGASVPEELAGACAQFGMPAMALVDRNGVYGAPRFHMAAKKAGIRAHIGSEITLHQRRLRYPLLAETREGYQNLCRLVTRMKLRAKKGEGAATLDELAEFSRGLICLTRHPDERLLDIFGRANVYAEIQRHYHREEEAHNQATVERARRLGIPLVATNGVAYAEPAQRELLDVFTCVRNKTTLAEAGRLLERNPSATSKRPPKWRACSPICPRPSRNTLRNFLAPGIHAGRSGLRISALSRAARAKRRCRFLRQRVDEGARRRYQPYHERARRQIERELALIEKLELPGYFLIVWDITIWCGASSSSRRRGLTPGRVHGDLQQHHAPHSLAGDSGPLPDGRRAGLHPERTECRPGSGHAQLPRKRSVEDRRWPGGHAQPGRLPARSGRE